MRRTVVISGGSLRSRRARPPASFLRITNTTSRSEKRALSFCGESIRARPWIERPFPLSQRRFLADRGSIAHFVTAIKERFGTVHILVNNAGIALDGVLALQRDEAVDQMIDVNLRGTIAITKTCVREMLINRRGCI